MATLGIMYPARGGLYNILGFGLLMVMVADGG